MIWPLVFLISIHQTGCQMSGYQITYYLHWFFPNAFELDLTHYLEVKCTWDDTKAIPGMTNKYYVTVL